MDFSDIQPYSDKQVHEVVASILKDKNTLCVVSGYLFPRFSFIMPKLTTALVGAYLRYKTRNLRSVYGLKLLLPYAKRLINNSIKSLDIRGVENLTDSESHLLLSNHRDIVTDGLITSYSLFSQGIATPEFAIGDNLMSNQLIAKLLKLNKCFLVKRSLSGMKEKFAALKHLSSYISNRVLNNSSHIWIAQREGRAKDGIDKTDIAVLKMLYMYSHKTDSFGDAINKLKVIPVSMSYEYDPLDIAKAREILKTELDGVYIKKDDEDAQSTVNGLLGYKRNVAITFGKALTVDKDITPEQFAILVDNSIARNQVIYPTHKIAYAIRAYGVESDSYRELRKRYPEQAEYFDKHKNKQSLDIYNKIIQIYSNIYKRSQV